MSFCNIRKGKIFDLHTEHVSESLSITYVVLFIECRNKSKNKRIVFQKYVGTINLTLSQKTRVSLQDTFVNKKVTFSQPFVCVSGCQSDLTLSTHFECEIRMIFIDYRSFYKENMLKSHKS